MLNQRRFHWRCDTVVIVPQHVANTNHFVPRDGGMALFDISRQAAGLGIDLDVTLDDPARFPVLRNIIE